MSLELTPKEFEDVEWKEVNPFAEQATRVEKWDRWFIGLAQYVSTASKDPSTKVGAVIVDEDYRVVSLGYNGFPKYVDDTSDRLEDRDLKLKMTVHAEMNAIIFAQRNLTNCHLYIWPFLACSRCAAAVIQSGITRCVAPYSDNPRWLEDFGVACMMFREAGVDVCILDKPADFNGYNFKKPE